MQRPCVQRPEFTSRDCPIRVTRVQSLQSVQWSLMLRFMNSHTWYKILVFVVQLASSDIQSLTSASQWIYFNAFWQRMLSTLHAWSIPFQISYMLNTTHTALSMMHPYDFKKLTLSIFYFATKHLSSWFIMDVKRILILMYCSEYICHAQQLTSI